MKATHWTLREIKSAHREFTREKSPRNHAKLRELRMRAAWEVREIEREVEALMTGQAQEI